MRKFLLLLLCLGLLGCKANFKEKIIKKEKQTNKEFFNKFIKNDLIIQSIDLCSQKFIIDIELIISIVYFESKFDVKATNNSNENGSIDRGLMQLNNFTFKDLTVNQFYDIECNIFNGTKHLKELLDKYNGNEILAVTAYNGGTWRVDNEKIKTSCLEYANKVLSYKNYLKMKYIENEKKI